MKNTMLKIISLLVCGIFSLTTVCHSMPAVYSVKVPNTYGKITQRWKSEQGSAKTVVLIQDAHASLEVQKNVAATICALLPQLVWEDTSGQMGSDVARVPFIGIEGAIGEYDLKSLRDIPFQKAKRIVGEEYVKKGFFVGAELASMLARQEFTLFGVEDEELFTKNVAVFTRLLRAQEDISGLLADAENAFAVQKEIRYTNALRSFDDLCMRYGSGEIDTGTFLLSVYQYVDNTGLDLYAYPLLCQLKERVSEKRMRADMSINEVAVLKEVRRVMYAIAHALAHTKEESVLVDEWMAHCIVKRIVTLQATRDDLAWLRNGDASSVVIRGRQSLKPYGCADTSLRDEVLHCSRRESKESSLQKYVALADTFYSYAEQRDRTMLDNLLAKMEVTGQMTGVLVAGGYHVDGLVSLMKERGIAYVTITPTITDLSNTVAYLDRMMAGQKSMSHALAGAASLQTNQLTIAGKLAWGQERYAEILRTALFKTYGEALIGDSEDIAGVIAALEGAGTSLDRSVAQVLRELFYEGLLEEIYTAYQNDTKLSLDDIKLRVGEDADALLFLTQFMREIDAQYAVFADEAGQASDVSLQKEVSFIEYVNQNKIWFVDTFSFYEECGILSREGKAVLTYVRDHQGQYLTDTVYCRQLDYLIRYFRGIPSMTGNAIKEQFPQRFFKMINEDVLGAWDMNTHLRIVEGCGNLCLGCPTQTKSRMRCMPYPLLIMLALSNQDFVQSFNYEPLYYADPSGAVYDDVLKLELFKYREPCIITHGYGAQYAAVAMKNIARLNESRRLKYLTISVIPIDREYFLLKNRGVSRAGIVAYYVERYINLIESFAPLCRSPQIRFSKLNAMYLNSEVQALSEVCDRVRSQLKEYLSVKGILCEDVYEDDECVHDILSQRMYEYVKPENYETVWKGQTTKVTFCSTQLAVTYCGDVLIDIEPTYISLNDAFDLCDSEDDFYRLFTMLTMEYDLIVAHDKRSLRYLSAGFDFFLQHRDDLKKADIYVPLRDPFPTQLREKYIQKKVHARPIQGPTLQKTVVASLFVPENEGDRQSLTQRQGVRRSIVNDEKYKVDDPDAIVDTVVAKIIKQRPESDVAQFEYVVRTLLGYGYSSYDIGSLSTWCRLSAVRVRDVDYGRLVTAMQLILQTGFHDSHFGQRDRPALKPLVDSSVAYAECDAYLRSTGFNQDDRQELLMRVCNKRSGWSFPRLECLKVLCEFDVVGRLHTCGVSSKEIKDFWLGDFLIQYEAMALSRSIFFITLASYGFSMPDKETALSCVATQKFQDVCQVAYQCIADGHEELRPLMTYAMVKKMHNEDVQRNYADLVKTLIRNVQEGLTPAVVKMIVAFICNEEDSVIMQKKIEIVERLLSAHGCHTPDLVGEVIQSIVRLMHDEVMQEDRLRSLEYVYRLFGEGNFREDLLHIDALFRFGKACQWRWQGELIRVYFQLVREETLTGHCEDDLRRLGIAADIPDRGAVFCAKVAEIVSAFDSPGTRVDGVEYRKNNFFLLLASMWFNWSNNLVFRVQEEMEARWWLYSPVCDLAFLAGYEKSGGSGRLLSVLDGVDTIERLTCGDWGSAKKWVRFIGHDPTYAIVQVKLEIILCCLEMRVPHYKISSMVNYLNNCDQKTLLLYVKRLAAYLHQEVRKDVTCFDAWQTVIDKDEYGETARQEGEAVVMALNRKKQSIAKKADDLISIRTIALAGNRSYLMYAAKRQRSHGANDAPLVIDNTPQGLPYWQWRHVQRIARNCGMSVVLLKDYAQNQEALLETLKDALFMYIGNDETLVSKRACAKILLWNCEEALSNIATLNAGVTLFVLRNKRRTIRLADVFTHWVAVPSAILMRGVDTIRKIYDREQVILTAA